MAAVGILLLVLCTLASIAFSARPGMAPKHPRAFGWSCAGLAIGVLLLLASIVTLAWRHMP